MMDEIWLPVNVHNGIFAENYEVSNKGNVRNKKTLALLSQCFCTKGYKQVSLNNRSIQKTIKVHRLVALAFLGSKPEGFHVNHKDFCKTNNCVENLEYVSAKENSRHAARMTNASLVINGQKITIPEAIEQFGVDGIHYYMVRRRVQINRWDVMRALTTPPMKPGRPRVNG